VATPARPPRSLDDDKGWSALGKAQRAILSVVAQYPEGVESTTAAVLAGYRHGTGGFNNAVGALRSADLIRGSGVLHATANGQHLAAGNVQPLPTGQAAVDYWCAHQAVRKVSSAPKILRHLFQIGGQWITPHDLAVQCGYQPGTGGFNNGLGRLRALGLVESQIGEVRCADVFLS
jgi:hypothetical protein